jgi:SAM-dependent methyltransferase
MLHDFPLFHSHLDLAHRYWEKILQEGDFAIDATCGNGNDTLKLAEILQKKGSVIGLDIQEEAIKRTRALLQSHLTEETLSRIHLYNQSHADFPPIASQHPIRLIVYNLGYLPKGNKQLTTLTESTLDSLSKALELVVPGGAISITCYPGHEEGAKEEKALLETVERLSPMLWNVCHHTFANRKASPSLLLIQKNCKN